MKRMVYVPVLLRIILIAAYNSSKYDVVAEIDAVTKSDFFEACMEGDHIAVANLIEVERELISKVDEHGQSCMMMASHPFKHLYEKQDNEIIEVVKILVEAGGDVNQRSDEDNFRMPAIAFHIFEFNYKTVEYLLEKGADVNVEFDRVYAGVFFEVDEQEPDTAEIFTPLDLLYYASKVHLGNSPIPEQSRYSITKTMTKTLEVLQKYNAKRFVGDVEL